MRETYALARERLGIISTIIGEVVGAIIAMLFYFTVFIPFSLISRLTSDPLHRKPSGQDFWLERQPVPNELERAKRQG